MLAEFVTSQHYLINTQNIKQEKSEISFKEIESRYIEVLSEEEAQNALYNLCDSEHYENLYRAILEVENGLENERSTDILSRVESMPNCWPIVHFKKERLVDGVYAKELQDTDDADEEHVLLDDYLRRIIRRLEKPWWSPIISNHKHEYIASHKYDKELQNFKLNSSSDVMWLSTSWDNQKSKIESYFEDKYRFGCSGRRNTRLQDDTWKLLNKEDIEEHRRNLWLDYTFGDGGCDSHAENPDELKTFEFRRELKGESIVLRGFFSKHDPALKCYRTFDVDKYFRDLNAMMDMVGSSQINCVLLSSNDEKKVSAVNKVDDKLILKETLEVEGSVVENVIEFDVKNHPSDWLLFNSNAVNNIYRKHDFFDSNILFICKDNKIDYISLFIPTITDYFDCFKDDVLDTENIQHGLKKYFSTCLEELSEYEFIYFLETKKRKQEEVQKKRKKESKTLKEDKSDKSVTTTVQNDPLWKFGNMGEYLQRLFSKVDKKGKKVELISDYTADDVAKSCIFRIPGNKKEIETILGELKQLRQKSKTVETTSFNIDEIKRRVSEFNQRSVTYFGKKHNIAFKGLEGIRLDSNVSESTREYMKSGDEYGNSRLEETNITRISDPPSDVAADFYDIVKAIGMKINADELLTMFDCFDYCWTTVLNRSKIRGIDMSANKNNRISFIYACIAIFGQIFGRDLAVEENFKENYSLDGSPWVSILADKYNAEKIYKERSLLAYVSHHYESNNETMKSKDLIIMRTKTILKLQNHIKRRLTDIVARQSESEKEPSEYESRSRTLKYREFNMNNEKKRFEPNSRTGNVKTSKPAQTQGWIVEEIDEVEKTIINFTSTNKLESSLTTDLIKSFKRDTKYGLSGYYAKLKGGEVGETIDKLKLTPILNKIEKNQTRDNYVYEGEFDINNEIVNWVRKWSKKVDLDDNLSSHLLSGKSILKKSIIREENKFYLHYIVLIKKIIKLHEYLEKINETSVGVDIILKSASNNYREKRDGLLEREDLRNMIKIYRSKERIEKNKIDDTMSDEDRQLFDARIQIYSEAPRPSDDPPLEMDDIDNLEPVLPQDEEDADNEM